MPNFVAMEKAATPKAARSFGVCDDQLNRPRYANADGFLAGEAPGGITTVDGAPVACRVRVFHRSPDGVTPRYDTLVAEVQSVTSGLWQVSGLDTTRRYDVVASLEGFNDVIVSNVAPVPINVVTISGTLAMGVADPTKVQGKLEIFGGTPPYTLQLTGPNPPAAGTLTVSGHTITANDPGPYTGPYTFTLIVTAANGATSSWPFYLDNQQDSFAFNPMGTYSLLGGTESSSRTTTLTSPGYSSWT